MERKQAGLTVGVPTAAAAIVTAMTAPGWVAIVLASMSLAGFVWGFGPAVARRISWLPSPARVSVETIEDDADWLLRVTPRDIRRTLRAKVEVVKAQPQLRGAHRGRVYTLQWRGSGREETDLLRGRSDTAWIASLNASADSGERSYIFSFVDPEDDLRTRSTSVRWVPGEPDATPPVVRLRVRLESEPHLPSLKEVVCRFDGDGAHRWVNGEWVGV